MRSKLQHFFACLIFFPRKNNNWRNLELGRLGSKNGVKCDWSHNSFPSPGSALERLFSATTQPLQIREGMLCLCFAEHSKECVARQVARALSQFNLSFNQQQLYCHYPWYLSAIGCNECDLIWFELGIGGLEPVAFSRVASDLSCRSLNPFLRASNKWLPLVVSCSHWFVLLLQLLFSHRPVSHDGVFPSFVCFFTFQGWHMLSFLGFLNCQAFGLYSLHICLTASFSFLSD